MEALEGVGAKVTKSQVVLDRPIKAIGVHEVKIALHPEVAVTVKVNVARSPEEADLQAQGIDVLQTMFERDAAPVAAEELEPIGSDTAETPETAAQPAEEAPTEGEGEQA
jgi:large subunit ribosomal protein L9